MSSPHKIALTTLIFIWVCYTTVKVILVHCFTVLQRISSYILTGLKLKASICSLLLRFFQGEAEIGSASPRTLGSSAAGQVPESRV